jgi:hypothetical protein
MGEGIQIDAHGEMVPVEYQSHIWLDWSVQQGLGTISLKEVLPTVMVPLTSRIIHTAFRLLMKHSFIPSILMMAGRIMFFSLLHLCFCFWQDPFYPCITPLFLAAQLLLPKDLLRQGSRQQLKLLCL